MTSLQQDPQPSIEPEEYISDDVDSGDFDDDYDDDDEDDAPFWDDEDDDQDEGPH